MPQSHTRMYWYVWLGTLPLTTTTTTRLPAANGTGLSSRRQKHILATIWGGLGPPHLRFSLFFLLDVTRSCATPLATLLGLQTGSKRSELTRWTLATNTSPVNSRLQGFFLLLMFSGNKTPTPPLPRPRHIQTARPTTVTTPYHPHAAHNAL